MISVSVPAAIMDQMDVRVRDHISEKLTYFPILFC